MSKADELLRYLVVARDGVNTPERQAQARIKTRDYLNRGKKELQGENVLSIIKETEVEIVAMRAVAVAANDTNMVEVYDAALGVFSTWTVAREA